MGGANLMATRRGVRDAICSLRLSVALAAAPAFMALEPESRDAMTTHRCSQRWMEARLPQRSSCEGAQVDESHRSDAARWQLPGAGLALACIFF